jgi:hypothetical protein
MDRRFRLGLVGAVAGLGAFAAAGLAGAQQGETVGNQLPSAAPPAAPAPAPDSALKGVETTAPADEGSAPPEDDAPAPSAKPAAAKPVTPPSRPRYGIAVLEAIDKVTAETMRFEAPIGQPIRYKSLVFIVHACETSASDETFQDAIAHVEIISAPQSPAGSPAPAPRQLFRGWMYANAPGLNLFQNPAYDAWVIACKTASPPA